MRRFLVLHLFEQPDATGGGLGVKLGYRKTLRAAIELGTDRVLRTADPTPHDRIQIRRPGEHPTWLYRDGTGRVCMWRKRPSERLELWGYSS